MFGLDTALAELKSVEEKVAYLAAEMTTCDRELQELTMIISQLMSSDFLQGVRAQVPEVQALFTNLCGILNVIKKYIILLQKTQQQVNPN